MMEYTVYFEIFGKKMKARVQARSMADASEKIKQEFVIHKVIEEPAIEEEWERMMRVMEGFLSKK
jgi:hypothetical protein